jgi:hypothetical protein
MKTVKLKLLVVCLVVSCLLTAGTAWGEPAFIVDSNEQWNSLLYPGPNESMVTPASPAEWNEYVQDWNGSPGDSNYCVPELYFYEGNDPCYPQNTACLVMAYGDPDQNVPDANYSAALKFVYGMDPDLHDCTITVNVTGFGPQAQTGTVLFGLKDKNNLRIWWRWNSLIKPAQIKIDTSKIYLGEPAGIAKPWNGQWRQADKFYGNCCTFDIGHVDYFVFGTIMPTGSAGAPPPGGSGQKPYGMLFYKYSVTKNVHGGKNYIKWSQQPVVLDANQPPIISGWDQWSDYNLPIVADDWECNDSRPVTDIHWWGSFINWDQPNLPPILPKAFNIGIWTDVPKGPGVPFSHPKKLVWTIDCNNWVWNFAGLDLDPCHVNNKKDACFQFNQLLSQDQWFYQEPSCIFDVNHGNLYPRVYWLSIAAVYNPQDYGKPGFYPWGWKTRAHNYNDDAVAITGVNLWPFVVNTTTWNTGYIIKPGWDVAFELSTNEPKAKLYHTDINGDGIVDFKDFALFADDWLTPDP